MSTITSTTFRSFAQIHTTLRITTLPLTLSELAVLVLIAYVLGFCTRYIKLPVTPTSQDLKITAEPQMVHEHGQAMSAERGRPSVASKKDLDTKYHPTEFDSILVVHDVQAPAASEATLACSVSLGYLDTFETGGELATPVSVHPSVKAIEERMARWHEWHTARSNLKTSEHAETAISPSTTPLKASTPTRTTFNTQALSYSPEHTPVKARNWNGGFYGNNRFHGLGKRFQEEAAETMQKVRNEKVETLYAILNGAEADGSPGGSLQTPVRVTSYPIGSYWSPDTPQH
ncbi:hypothetical protein VNI00_011379 [Paramarasmius palmivorus]|uniref:Uncharacterized protein n=1 Tax=Paramarasmius palmivorus TaxID=297713 RepID=A0AAW0CCI8_9AGAR